MSDTDKPQDDAQAPAGAPENDDPAQADRVEGDNPTSQEGGGTTEIPIVDRDAAPDAMPNAAHRSAASAYATMAAAANPQAAPDPAHAQPAEAAGLAEDAEADVWDELDVAPPGGEAREEDGGFDGELEAQLAETKEQLLRAVAEQENMRRRQAKELDDAHKFALTKFSRDLLSVADNLSRALASVPEGATPDAAALEGLLTGVKLTEKELQSAFDKHGLHKIDPTGEKFDPNFHEAMFEVPTNDAPAGQVMQVIEPGYVLNGRVVRPARVGVSKALG